MESPIQWPALDSGPAPQWTGREFTLPGGNTSVLCYHSNESGWSEDLTSFHEESAGQHHYVDVASRRHALNALAPVLAKPAPLVMEVGCSSGYFLEALKAEAPHAFLVGADYISRPLFALSERLPGVPLLQFDLTRSPFESPLFDGIVLLNVLEHIEDDALALQKLHAMLKPGGIAVIELPAGPHLYDYYDRHLMHFRRYDLDGLSQLVRNAGFDIERASHLGCFLYPAFYVAKKLNQQKKDTLSTAEREAAVSEDIQTGAGNPLMHGLMRAELALGRYLRYPFGIRCLLVARKPA